MTLPLEAIPKIDTSLGSDSKELTLPLSDSEGIPLMESDSEGIDNIFEDLKMVFAFGIGFVALILTIYVTFLNNNSKKLKRFLKS